MLGARNGMQVAGREKAIDAGMEGRAYRVQGMGCAVQDEMQRAKNGL